MHSTPSPRRRALVAIVAPLVVLGCRAQVPNQPKNELPTSNAVQREPPEIAKPRAPLDREEIIVAVLRAATAAALGQDDHQTQLKLKGNRFEFRSRFACSGSDAKAESGWTYDKEKGVLRARVRADVNYEDTDFGEPIREDYEGAVGFTIQRPWMLVDGCPGPTFNQMNGGPAIRLVQFFTGSDSRVQRPETSYETVTQIQPDEIPAQGLALLLSGRLEPLRNGRPIHCFVAQGRMACTVSVLIDRVAIEDPERGKVLGEWGAS